jgi:hypothetical protein
MTVRELVALGRYPWHGALGRFTATDRDKVEEAMRLTDVTDFADRLVESLSGGECQSALKNDPLSASKIDPLPEQLVPVAHRGDPRAAECPPRG